MRATEITLHRQSARLEIGFDNGNHFTLSAEYLRVYSPSAEVQGHGPGQEVLQHGKRDVAITDLIPQGNYAIKIVFSDGHDSGIFSWEYLDQLGREFDTRWQAYLERLEAAGKQRAPAFIEVRMVDPD